MTQLNSTKRSCQPHMPASTMRTATRYRHHMPFHSADRNIANCCIQNTLSLVMKAVQTMLARRATTLGRVDIRGGASQVVRSNTGPKNAQERVGDFSRLQLRSLRPCNDNMAPTRLAVRAYAVQANVVEPSSLTHDGMSRRRITDRLLHSVHRYVGHHHRPVPAVWGYQSYRIERGS